MSFNFNNPVCLLTGDEFLPKDGVSFADQVLEYFQSLGGKKQMTGMMGAPIVIGTDSFICVVVVIYNLIDCRLYLHETFLTEKIPEIAASSLVRVGEAESPQSRGSVAKILMSFLKTK